LYDDIAVTSHASQALPGRLADGFPLSEDLPLVDIEHQPRRREATLANAMSRCLDAHSLA
jgi:hypothetical protein